MKKSTGLFDCKKKEIFVGDLVAHAWGWFNWDGKQQTKFKIHKIKQVKEDNTVRYLLGDCYNIWKGKEVQKITLKEFKELNISLETNFFQHNGKVIKYTSQHFLQMNDDDYKEYLKGEENRIRKLFFNT